MHWVSQLLSSASELKGNAFILFRRAIGHVKKQETTPPPGGGFKREQELSREAAVLWSKAPQEMKDYLEASSQNRPRHDFVHYDPTRKPARKRKPFKGTSKQPDPSKDLALPNPKAPARPIVPIPPSRPAVPENSISSPVRIKWRPPQTSAHHASSTSDGYNVSCKGSRLPSLLDQGSAVAEKGLAKVRRRR